VTVEPPDEQAGCDAIAIVPVESDMVAFTVLELPPLPVVQPIVEVQFDGIE
jgi:hypothetical protein